MEVSDFVDRPFGVPLPIELRLPVPPSVNAMYGNNKSGRGRGRYPTKAYKQWLALAEACALSQKKNWVGKEITGPAKLDIRLPMSTRGDVTNRIKATEDFIVSLGITSDDRNNHKVSIERDPKVDCCVVFIEAWDTPPR